MTDRIEVRGIRVVGRHGLLEEERARSQPFEVDVTLECDLTAAGRSDDISDTVNYGTLTETVANIVGCESHLLLERLAQRIADEVSEDPRVTAIVVAVRKLRPPIPVDVASAGVSIRRSR